MREKLQETIKQATREIKVHLHDRALFKLNTIIRTIELFEKELNTQFSNLKEFVEFVRLIN